MGFLQACCIFEISVK